MTNKSRWPDQDAFLDFSMREQETDGKVRCTAVAVCDADGNPAQSFYQGQEAHFFYEFEILGDIGVPCGGLEFHNADGLVIHGKNSFQHDAELPQSALQGQRLRFHHVIKLDVGPNQYWFSLGFASTDERSYRAYSSGAIGHEQFAPVVHCRIADVSSFAVRYDQQGKLRHHGVANLKSESLLTVIPPDAASATRLRRSPGASDFPSTVIHVTHWKAGSQWIHKIFNACLPDRVVAPHLNQSQFLTSPIQPGKVYPTIYVNKAQFDRTNLPPNTHRFVVIRDLRDTLVSAYFSMKISHPNVNNALTPLRERLQRLDQEEGLLFMIDNWVPACAKIQTSWIEANEPLIRYEDLLEHDESILMDVLINRCRLPVEKEFLRQAIIANRFEKATAGRTRGNEDIHAHERKGVAGDWQNHFTRRVKDTFKNRYAGLLVAAGYERDLNW